MGLNPKSWAEAFVAELTIAGERVPFERVLARHLDTITMLRTASSLTWRSLASLLARAGGRRADGGLISADQLRVGHARLVRQATRRAADSAQGDRRLRPSVDRPVARATPIAIVERPSPHMQAADNALPARVAGPPMQTSPTDDVSDDDITIALSRLNKLP